jgi:uncharacterized protein YkwD
MSNRLLSMVLSITFLSGCQSWSLPKVVPTIASTPIIQPTNAPLVDPSSLLSIEQAIAQQINQYRRSRNLPPLRLNSQISQQARIHSEQMAAKLTPFSNEGLQQRLKNLGSSIPYQTVAENLAMNQGISDPATFTVQGWLKNPKLRKNLAGKFDLMGIGVAKNTNGEYYITQILLQQPPATQTLKKPEDLLSKSPQIDSAFLLTLEEETHRQVNQYRISRNLPPLRLDPSISQVARIHSQNMAKKKASFSHDGFEKRVKEIGKNHAYQAAAENLAFNQGFVDPVTVSVQGWIKSPGHRKNMEGEFNVTGIGVAKNAEGEYYFTQLFILEP